MIYLPIDYMNELRESFKKYPVLNKDFRNSYNNLTYHLTGVGKAQNKDEIIPINNLYENLWYGIVIEWRENQDFVFIERRQKKTRNFIPLISVHFYVKKESNDETLSFIRAEWDNFSQAGVIHPQPHWHFTFSQSVFTSLMREYSSLESDDWNDMLLNEYKHFSEEFPIARMHMSLSEKWVEQGSMSFDVPEANNLASWINSLLTHVQTEYRYMIEK